MIKYVLEVFLNSHLMNICSKLISLLEISYTFYSLDLLVMCSVVNFHFSRTLEYFYYNSFLYNMPSNVSEFLTFY